MQLSSLTNPSLLFPNIAGQSAAGLLMTFAGLLAEQGVVADAADLYSRLQEREDLGSTGIGQGVAIPHCKIDGLDKVLVAVATSAEGVDFGAVDGERVRLFFMVLSPTKEPAAHLQSLAAISKWVKGDHGLQQLLESDDPAKMMTLLGDGAAAT